MTEELLRQNLVPGSGVIAVTNLTMWIISFWEWLMGRDRKGSEMSATSKALEQLRLFSLADSGQSLDQKVDRRPVKTKLRRFLPEKRKALVIGLQMICAMDWLKVFQNFAHAQRLCPRLRLSMAD